MWLTYLRCSGRAGESNRHESKEEAGGTEVISAAEEVCRHRAAWVAHRDVPYACGAVTRQKWEVFHHRTSHHCPFVWVTADLVNKSNKLSLYNESSKGRLVGMHLFQCQSALASV